MRFLLASLCFKFNRDIFTKINWNWSINGKWLIFLNLFKTTWLSISLRSHARLHEIVFWCTLSIYCDDRKHVSYLALFPSFSCILSLFSLNFLRAFLWIIQFFWSFVKCKTQSTVVSRVMLVNIWEKNGKWIILYNDRMIMMIIIMTRYKSGM